MVLARALAVLMVDRLLLRASGRGQEAVTGKYNDPQWGSRWTRPRLLHSTNGSQRSGGRYIRPLIGVAVAASAGEARRSVGRRSHSTARVPPGELVEA